jgi:hypothetical protein
MLQIDARMQHSAAQRSTLLLGRSAAAAVGRNARTQQSGSCDESATDPTR